MSKNEFSLFKKFVNKEQAIELTDLLKEHDIPFKIDINALSYDMTYANNATDKDYEVRILQSDFEKANRVVEDSFNEVINQFKGEHYLYDFTNEELYDILLKPDEWGTFDYKLAQKILLERGKQIDNELLSSLKKQRIKDLSKLEEDNGSWVAAGYIFCLLGGFLGFFIGYHLYFGKKTLPNGKKIYQFPEEDRIQGKLLMFLSPILLFIYGYLING